MTNTIIFCYGYLFRVSVFVKNCSFNWYNFAIEKTWLLGFISLSVTLNGHQVLFISANVVFLGNVFWSITHTHKTVSGLFMLKNSFWNLLNVDWSIHVVLWHALNSWSNANINDAHFNFSSNCGTCLKSWWT